MDAQIATAMMQEAASLNVGYTVFAILIVLIVFAFIFRIGEQVLGFNTKAFLNHVEEVARRAAKGEPGGSLWPGITLLLSVQLVLCVVLYIGLR